MPSSERRTFLTASKATRTARLPLRSAFGVPLAPALLLVVLSFTSARAARSEQRATAAEASSLPQVLLAVDDQSFPFIRGVELKPQSPEKHAGNPIVMRGVEGQPDSHRAQQPAVMRDGDTWRMWYSAHDGTGTAGLRVAYAESKDGLTWTKPELGLVEFRGHRRNNLVAAQPGLNTVSVIVDPANPPAKRFIMAGEDMRWFGRNGGVGWTLTGPSIARIDVSPDGLHWTPVQDSPGLIMPQNEAAVIYRFRGRYHLGGHQISPLLRLPLQAHDLGGYLGPRAFVVWRSPVLERWPVEYAVAFAKPMQSSSPYHRGWDREEVHLGAAVTPIGDLCVGVYGQWHHPPTSTETQKPSPAYSGADVSVDLGLIVSNDGVRFREPLPGFTLIGRDQELRWDRDHRDNRTADAILLLQGSIVNTRERTFIYYSAATPGGNVAGVKSNIGVATLPRDRFAAWKMLPGAPGGGSCTTKTIAPGADRKLYANADVPAGAVLRFSLLDEDGLAPLPGFEASEPVTSGLDAPVSWRGQANLPSGMPFRIRAHLQGETRLFALAVN